MTDDPHSMCAFWLIGVEDEPEHSAEICVAEIFGRDVGADRTRIGMGVHPFGDPRITDEFAQHPVAVDAREVHDYAVDWTPDGVVFLVDGERVAAVGQAPAYPVQVMLGIYAFPDEDGVLPPPASPRELLVERFRGLRRNRP